MAKQCRQKDQSRLPTKGKHHDLLKIYNSVNSRYFNNFISARITWGRKLDTPRRGHQTIRMGCVAVETGLIIIHRALDRSWVPRFFIECLIFHEMLHLKYPPRQKNGRQANHHKQFLAAESAFANYAKAARWEKDNLNRLLFF